MSLMVGGQALCAPPMVSGAVPAEIFQALCEKIRLDSRVGRRLVEACQLESLDDFAYFFVREEEVGQLVDSI